jgi:hypothetical protein
MTTKRRTTNAKTSQYTCTACGLKYAVGETIVTGTLTREQLKRRGERRAGVCHCGLPFPTHFGCTKNVMWSLNLHEQEQRPSFPPRTLLRVAAGNASTRASPKFRETSDRMRQDPAFADSVLATAEAAARRMSSSTLESIKQEGERRLRSVLKARRAVSDRLTAAAADEASDDEGVRYRVSLPSREPKAVLLTSEASA